MYKGIKAKDIQDFEKAAKKLDEIIKRIDEYAPDAWVYAAEDGLILMADHNYKNALDIDTSLVTCIKVYKIDGGAF